MKQKPARPKNGKPNFIETLKTQQALARAASEMAMIQKVGTAFFLAATAELMDTYHWTPAQCADFLTAVTQRTRATLLPPLSDFKIEPVEPL